jgi:hypothetical protein
MADFISGLVNFVGATISQSLTTANLKDFSHANKLYVGDQFRLVPKNGFLFHVFIDINGIIEDPANPDGIREFGLMAKTADLPRFSIDTKTLNTYNRATVVQSKVKYDPVTLTFHDDSSNLIRNFWINYYITYYRDSDYNLSQYSLPFKYTEQQITEFGFSPMGSRPLPFLKAIRIYSLHKKRFSEYILVNPIIKSLKHGTHDNQTTDSIMSHEMVIEYESVLYSDGRVTLGDPKGFAELHYDASASPLTPGGGGPRTIFGPGGFLDTGRDILKDYNNGDYGMALFKAARGIKSAKSMNLKNAFKQEINTAVTGAITESITNRRIMVPNLITTGAITNVPFSGINVSTGLALLAGAQMIASSRPPTPINGSSINPITQSSSGNNPPSNYNRSFPPPPLAGPAINQQVIQTVNNQSNQAGNSNQQQVNPTGRKQQIDNRIAFLNQRLGVLATETTNASNQQTQATTNLNALNSQLTQANALPDSTPNKQEVIQRITQSISVQTGIISSSQTIYNNSIQDQNSVKGEIQALKSERDTLT